MIKVLRNGKNYNKKRSENKKTLIKISKMFLFVMYLLFFLSFTVNGMSVINLEYLVNILLLSKAGLLESQLFILVSFAEHHS